MSKLTTILRESFFVAIIYSFLLVMIHTSEEQKIDGKHIMFNQTNEGTDWFSYDAYSTDFEIRA